MIIFIFSPWLQGFFGFKADGQFVLVSKITLHKGSSLAGPTILLHKIQNLYFEIRTADYESAGRLALYGKGQVLGSSPGGPTTFTV